MRSIRWMLASLGLAMGAAYSAPHRGDTLTLRQPDGTLIQARGFGDEFYGRLESLDGYTLTQDPATRWFHYARLNAAGDGFVPTGTRYLGTGGGGSFRSPGSVAPPDLSRGLDLPKAQRVARHAENFARLRGRKPGTRSKAPGSAAAAAALAGNIRGLTLLVDFSDDPATVAQGEISNYLNQPGYAGFGNRGSVRDYFSDVSGGRLIYTNHVAAYYRAQHPKTYYTDPSLGLGVRAQELIVEALQALDAQGFDFSTLAVDAYGAMRAINLFYSGYVQNAWAQGMWPHMGYMGQVFTADGVTTGAYQVTNVGDMLSLGTFCHENGHMLFGWPDLYDTSFESVGLGWYCLMGYIGPANDPVPPNPWLRGTAGWEAATVIPSTATPTTYTHTANSQSHFRYNRPGFPQEFFLIESRRFEGRNTGFPDQGLAIWHVDEFGYNSCNDMTPQCHFAISIEQADGLFELERFFSYGGPGDLFSNGYRTEFTDFTLPDSKWWSGDPSGFNIVNIGPLGATQSFTVQSGEFQDLDIGGPARPGRASDAGGTLTLEGGGADIQGNADQFFFHFRSLIGDGEIIVRIQGLEDTHPWAKAGVMFRDGAAAGAPNVLLAVTPRNGTTFQFRGSAGGGTSSSATPGPAPRWLKLARQSALFTGFHSVDGIAWTAFGAATVAMGENLLAGLAVTSHDNATLATAVATDLRLLRSPWKGADIGSPAQAGTYAYDIGGNHGTVRGGGVDIWGLSDQFFFLHQAFTGDGRLMVRVNSLTPTDPWAKAGLMLRAGLDPASPNVFTAITPGNGTAFQIRPQYGAATTSTRQAAAAPRWLKLESRDGQYISQHSADGVAWTELGREEAVFSHAFAGIAVTSHNSSQLTTAAFDRVEMEPGIPFLYTGGATFTEVTGNGDGEPNPGEELFVYLGASNLGSGKSRNVTAVLSTDDTCIAILSATAAYGDVLPGMTTDPQPYRFRASSHCPDHDVQMLLAFTDSFGDEWVSGFTIGIVVRYSISGTVRTAAGPPPPRTYVECFPRDLPDVGEVRPDGSYTIGRLQPGTYDCQVIAPGYQTAYAGPVTVPPSRADVDFLLTRPQVQLDRAGVAETLTVGQSRTVPVRISNPGDAPLEIFQISHPGGVYLFRDSEAPGGPAFAWTDIRATGTRLAMTDGMSGVMGIRPLGFSFPYYGTGRNTVVISPHGYIAFEDHYPLLFNSSLPTYHNVPDVLAGFWDEIQPSTTQGGIYFQEFGDRAVIQYDAVPRAFSGTGAYTFQIVLYRDGVIRYFYQAMGPADGGTVGIQNGPEKGLGVVFDAPYVKDGLAVEFRPLARDWLAFSPASGVVPPGGSLNLNLVLDAFDLPAGVHTTRLTLFHNVPDGTLLTLPVSLTVQGEPGGVRRELWTGIPGAALSSLRAHPDFPHSPDATCILPAFEAPRNSGDNYGQRLRAYLTPPVTGDYTFWIAGDNQSELRLSPDEHPGRAVAVARVSAWTDFREWSFASEQRSAPVRLVAGRRYYIEALHKEGRGGDHLSVGWRGPGIAGNAERPIPGLRLTPFAPESWHGLDIGNPAGAGSHTPAGSGFSVAGGGKDIWGASDQFRFVFRPLVGNGQITARVASVENTDPWAKAGVMIRETLAGNSRHAFTAVSAANGLAFQRRVTAGSQSAHTGQAGAAPRWVRLKRAGNVFTSYVSANGSTWTLLGSETIVMGATAWIGLAVTSHNPAALSTAVFESVNAPLP